MNKEDCQMYIMTGNCPLRVQCMQRHPILKTVKKSKLKYKKQIFNKSSQQKSKQSQQCSCCKSNPNNCSNSQVCKQIKKCTCIATKKEIDQGYNQICDCCFGDFENCQSPLCEQLGMCQCQLHQDMENEQKTLQGEYFEQNKNCQCCSGYVFTCKGQNCDSHCSCFN